MMHEVLVYRSPFEAWLWTTTPGSIVLLIIAGGCAVAFVAFVGAWRRTARRIEQDRRRMERDMRP